MAGVLLVGVVIEESEGVFFPSNDGQEPPGRDVNAEGAEPLGVGAEDLLRENGAAAEEVRVSVEFVIVVAEVVEGSLVAVVLEVIEVGIIEGAVVEAEGVEDPAVTAARIFADEAESGWLDARAKPLVDTGTAETSWCSSTALGWGLGGLVADPRLL